MGFSLDAAVGASSLAVLRRLLAAVASLVTGSGVRRLLAAVAPPVAGSGCSGFRGCSSQTPERRPSSCGVQS